MALTLALPASTAFNLFGWIQTQPQRGHRVSPDYCEDLPSSWSRQAKLAQLDSSIPTEHEETRTRVATFAMGCYWGAELAFQRTPGVIATCVGHTGYESGGCNEAVQLLFDPRQTSYEALCEVLWSHIDPTLRNQVGLDRGSTYRHALYPHSAEDLEVAAASVEQQRVALAPATVWTSVQPAELFYVAEPRHQRYLERGMKGTPQCAAKECRDPIRCYGGVASSA